MKRIPMMLLLVSPYGLLGLLLTENPARVLPAGWALVCLLVFLPNMLYAFCLPRLGFSPEQILGWNLVLKLSSIPVYCLVFCAALLMGVFVIPLLPFLVLFDYSLLLPSSMYGISGVKLARRRGLMSRWGSVLHILLQLTFCLDVCSALYLYFTVKNRKKRRCAP